ncbi:Uncharacterised protein [Mycobacteroides abscessus]|nr:Uncharacterised protein [Mycobacteroides abscessus]
MTTRRRARSDAGAVPASARARAASTVACHVRKSLGVASSPRRSLMPAWTSALVTSCHTALPVASTSRHASSSTPPRRRLSVVTSSATTGSSTITSRTWPDFAG